MSLKSPAHRPYFTWRGNVFATGFCVAGEACISGANSADVAVDVAQRAAQGSGLLHSDRAPDAAISVWSARRGKSRVVAGFFGA